MKTVFICEGHDDLWFLYYYLEKKCNWTIDGDKWKTNKIPQKNGRKAIFIRSNDSESIGAIVTGNGQTGISKVIKDILIINSHVVMNDAINKIVIFRDCDDRFPDYVASEMNEIFENKVQLKNCHVSEYKMEVDSEELIVKILPVVIPFDEQGAIETLIMKSISDKSDIGKYVVKHANEYIDSAIENVRPEYLKKQREQTKARYSASLAITNPRKSRDDFRELMMSCDWENSPSIDLHMKEVREFIK